MHHATWLDAVGRGQSVVLRREFELGVVRNGMNRLNGSLSIAPGTDDDRGFMSWRPTSDNLTCTG